MKKTITILSVFCALLFVVNTNAQSLNSLKKKASETVSNDKTAKYKALLEKPEIQTKVKEQLINNESLRNETISFLKKEPSVKTDVAAIVGKANKPSAGMGLGAVSKSAIMKNLLSNPKITAVALNYVKGNPKILTKVMGLIGM